MKKVDKNKSINSLIRTEKYTVDYDGFDLSNFKEILEGQGREKHLEKLSQC